MAKLTVEGFPTVEIAAPKRLVLAIEQDASEDVLHAGGGNGRGTTCQVERIAGEPQQTTEAERNKLAERNLTGGRRPCQTMCDPDMTVRALRRLAGSGRPDPGRTPL